MIGRRQSVFTQANADRPWVLAGLVAGLVVADLEDDRRADRQLLKFDGLEGAAVEEKLPPIFAADKSKAPVDDQVGYSALKIPPGQATGSSQTR